MRIVDTGSGAPIVLIPGIQGRWEWMKPAVDALARDYRVITFSFADEPTCHGRFDPAHGFDCYVDQVREALDIAGLSRAAIAGVSYGGLVAAAFALRYPRQTSALVLVSAVPPTWSPDARVRFYLKAPVLLSPLFMLASLRMHKEIAAASPGVLRGMAASLRHGLNVVTHMFSPSRMARRVRLLDTVELTEELRRLRLPTLVVTGESTLDRVVPVARTEEYLEMWPHAERVTILRTGHLGLITRADRFAAAVGGFVARHAAAAEEAAHQEKKVG